MSLSEILKSISYQAYNLGPIPLILIILAFIMSIYFAIHFDDLRALIKRWYEDEIPKEAGAPPKFKKQ